MSVAVASTSPFIQGEYNRPSDILKGYHRQAAKFLSIKNGWNEEFLLKLIEKIFIPRENGFKEAKIKIYRKNKHGDRVPDMMYARDFFNECREKNYHLSPSLVAYEHLEKELSVNSYATDMFIEGRREYKNLRQTVPRSGELWRAYNEIQNALKIFNNAQSGGMSSSGTPIHNHSGHTSLTSITRCLTSTANICNERLITGNRLLLNYEVTMQLFVSTLAFADKETIQEAIDVFKLNYASTEQVMDMVRKSSRYYHNDKVGINTIEQFVKRLSPLDRTIILCTMDLRGLYTVNKEVVTKFIEDFSHIPEFPEGLTEEDGIKPDNGDRKILCVTKLGEGATQEKINYLNKYHLTVEKKWGLFIKAFLRAKIPPSSLFSVKEMVRESVLTSDTDSSIYSVDLLSKDLVTDSGSGIVFNGVLTYFIRCIAVDQHARLSKNINIANKHLYRNNMKNEYLFGSYVTTDMSKHYFALQLMVEGVINNTLELECKGVHLRGVNIAMKVRDLGMDLMMETLGVIHEGKQMNAPELLKRIGDMERELQEELSTGGWSWLSKSTIKAAEMYSDPESSVHYYHQLWENAFAPFYGEAPSLPYRAFKVKLNTNNRGKLSEYLDQMENKQMAQFIREQTNGRGKLEMFYVPEEMVLSIGGIPKEMLGAIDTRTIISENLSNLYTILRSLGIYITNKKITRLISDEH